MADYDIGEAFQRVEEEMIDSMIRNMKHHITVEKAEGLNYAQWQAEQLAALHEYRKRNAKEFGNYFSTINKEIDTALKMAYKNGEMDQEVKILEAIKKGFVPPKVGRIGATTGDFFKINDRRMKALFKATQAEMRKAETAMLRMANDEYRKTIFNAGVYYDTGAGTLEQCVDMASKDYLARGINCIEYANGRRVAIDAYAKMALRTNATRSYLAGEATMRDDWGINTVIVNKRGVACPMCLQWVGRVYYDDVWGTVPVTDDKYPRLSTAIQGGLYHPNCKDSHTTYFDGINSEPTPMTKAQEQEAARVYNLEQQQRYNERNIRKYKRLRDGSLDDKNKEYYSGKTQEWEERNEIFVKAHGDVLKRRYDNEKIHGITSFTPPPVAPKITPPTIPEPPKVVEPPKAIEPPVAKVETPSIAQSNTMANEAIQAAYERRRIKHNLQEVPIDELKNSPLNPVKSDFTGVSEETADKFSSVFADLSKQYDTGVQSITVGDKKDFFGSRTFAVTRHNTITASNTVVLNPNKMKDYSAALSRIQELSEKGYCIKIADGKLAEYIPTHEFAHTLMDMKSPLKNFVGFEAKHIRKARKEIQSVYDEYMAELQRMQSELYTASHDPIFKDFNAPVEEQFKMFAKVDDLKKQIANFKLSDYAGENADEFLAEAFAQHHVGEGSNPYSERVYDILNKTFGIDAEIVAKVKVPKIVPEDFASEFTSTAAKKKQTQLFVDKVNAAKDADPKTVELFQKMRDHDRIGKDGIPFKISYTQDDHALSRRYSFDSDDLMEVGLKIPKLSPDNADGMGAVCHEEGHFIDLLHGSGHHMKSAKFEPLRNAIKKYQQNPTIGTSVDDVFKAFNAECDSIDEVAQKKYKAVREALTDAVSANKMQYKEYVKQWKRAYKDEWAETDSLKRGALGGCVGGLQDIYDALSRGRFADSRVIYYGHGGKYYNSAVGVEKAASEIWANYVSLTINRPDLVRMLKEDKPELVEALEALRDEMLKGV